MQIKETIGVPFLGSVEYGGYAGPQCRAADERGAQDRDQLGHRVCCAVRHRPLTDNSLAYRAADLDVNVRVRRQRRHAAREEMRFHALWTSRPPRWPCSPHQLFRPMLELPCSGELRLRNASKSRRRAPVCKYRSPPTSMLDREQEAFT
jgi:hypothetical protein